MRVNQDPTCNLTIASDEVKVIGSHAQASVGPMQLNQGDMQACFLFSFANGQSSAHGRRGSFAAGK